LDFPAQFGNRAQRFSCRAACLSIGLHAPVGRDIKQALTAESGLAQQARSRNRRHRGSATQSDLRVFVVFRVVAIPDPLLLLPNVAAFLVSLPHSVSAYRTRVAVSNRQMLGAMVVFMSVQWTVASAAFKAAFAAIPEAVPISLLVAGGITVFATNFYRIVEIDLSGHPERPIFVGGGNGGVRALRRSLE
jgi:hypothetical protein